jgi:hypothetical protein
LLTLAKGQEDIGAIFFDFTNVTVGENGKNTTPSVASRLVATVAPLKKKTVESCRSFLLSSRQFGQLLKA